MATARKASRGKSGANGNGRGPKRLTTDDILAARDIREEDVEVPEWGGTVRIRSITKKRSQQMREAATVDGELDEDRLEMAIFIEGVIDPVFESEQFEQLREKASSAIDRVIIAINTLNGETAAAAEAAEKSFRPRR